MSTDSTYENNGLKFRRIVKEDGTEVVELISKAGDKKKPSKSSKKAKAKEQTAK